jgi:hypothetical protein
MRNFNQTVLKLWFPKQVYRFANALAGVTFSKQDETTKAEASTRSTDQGPEKTKAAHCAAFHWVHLQLKSFQLVSGQSAYPNH